MKVINKTVWQTAHLKAILQRAAEQEFDDPARRKKLVVEVAYTRRDGCSGCAWYHGNHAVVRIANPRGRYAHQIDLTRLKLEFASVACHEFAHCRGMRHSQMPAYYKWTGSWKAYVAWATDFPLEAVTPKVVVLSKAEVVDRKLAHVLAMKRKAETRAKRAQTLLRKWKQKEAYYRRQAAALSPREAETAAVYVGGRHRLARLRNTHGVVKT